ncbi:hypothetical protein D3C85_1316700 [compost metagenome]
MGDHHQCQGQRRQGHVVQAFGQRLAGVDAGQAGQPAGLYRQRQDQQVRQEELRKGNATQRGDVDQAVEQAVAVDRRQEAQRQGQRDRNQRGERGQQQRIGQAGGEQLRDGPAIGQ